MKLYEQSKSVGCLEPRQLLRHMITLRRSAILTLVPMLFSESLYEWSSLMNYCFIISVFSSCITCRILHFLPEPYDDRPYFWPESGSYWQHNQYLSIWTKTKSIFQGEGRFILLLKAHFGQYIYSTYLFFSHTSNKTRQVDERGKVQNVQFFLHRSLVIAFFSLTKRQAWH